MKGDSVVFIKGYGVREWGRPDSITVHARFGNMSTTKANSPGVGNSAGFNCRLSVGGVMRTFSLVGSILLIAAGPVPGQRLAQPFPAAATLRVTVRWAVTDSVQRVIRPTYWVEGGVIGGLAVGTFGAILITGLCGNSEGPAESCTDNTVLAAFFGAAVGFTVGALIGGQFPKHRDPDPSS